MLAAVAAALAAIALVAFLVTRDSGGSLPGVDPNYVGGIDPDGNAIVAAIPVGVSPGPVAAGAGSVWVGNVQDRTLTRIDARLRSPVRALSLGDRTPTAVAAGRSGVWVVHGLSGELSRIDTQFDRVSRTIQVTDRRFSANGAVAIGTRDGP